METHKNIETKDGYLLTMHRIPYPKNANYLRGEKRQPVLLIHGMLGCSGHFLLQGDNSLAYMLAEAGYDVWLGNVRGVVYSREHKTLNYAKDTEYWQFSMHEMGIYDLPAMIDYILGVTNSENLHYIGYSQGCVTFFIMCSELPEYSKKIALFTGLSPLIYVKNARHPWLPILSRFQTQLRFFTSQVGLCGVRVGLFRKYEGLFTSNSWGRNFIKFMIFAAFGTKLYRLKNETVGTAVKFIQGINYHSIYHAMQIFNKSKAEQFVQYDYGTKKNMEVYGSETAKDYCVENVKCPVLLYYSDSDWFMPAENATLLAEKLSNVIAHHKIESKDFSHFDFLIAEEAVEKVYKPMISTFADFQNQKV
ncbi:lipase 1-like isoform X1 [Atheta coriaria]|uniref:lipase 1-like isoform X1 n=1 Tax=Dalotia coriaria TaxID=877792 RepID=UPI0031F3A014